MPPNLEEFTLGTDYGSYLDYFEKVMFAWDMMIQKLRIRFAIWKGAQEQLDKYYGNISTKKNLLVARQKGIRINGTYYWHFPDGSPAYYRTVYKKAIESELPDFISVDAEQRRCMRADGTWYIPSHAQVGETLQALGEGLIQDFPEKRFLLYSSPGYILEFCPEIMPWVSTLEQFAAGWPDWGLDGYRQSWEETAAGTMRQVTNYDVPAPLPYRMINIVQESNIRLTPESKQSILHQFSSRILLPNDLNIPEEARHQYDWILYKGSEQKLFNWVNFLEDIPTPEVPPIPAPSSELTLESLDARLKKIESLPWYKQFFPVMQK